MSVEYLCGCGRRYPLAELYWSDTCNKIVCPWPSCSLQEIDSYFCRYQMDNLPSKEAAAYKNRSARTFECPDCKSTLQTLKEDDKYIFFCAHCRWDSEAILTDEDPDTLMMVANAREREEHVFDALLAHYQQKATSTNQTQAMKRLSSIPSTRFLKPVRPTIQYGWKMEHLEAKLKETSTTVPSPVDLALERQCEEKVSNSPFVVEISARDSAKIQDMSTVSTLAQRNLCTPLLQARNTARLFPSRPELRVKRSWRCVESMANGAPGILVKPQINPMTGDSSMVVVASWWKKATLAIHYLPNITIQHRWDNSGYAWLLVENPMEEDIVLVLTSQGNGVPTAPVRVGAYEDPNLIDLSNDEIEKFIEMKDVGDKDILSSRNYVKIKVAAGQNGSTSLEMHVDMYQAEEEEKAITELQRFSSFGVVLDIPRV
ncbi:hypothetical protein LEN26_020180 [Aphanomyces euteiches]|nr:hypothetical protein LEN26_020180 [Aphanomyces euteiches]KAH9129486.1 hypothetical protein AeMF1_000463 [Aphanomyces euteiches]KAH9188306.1 hypothetical protein AeNC1_009713 [Aphanomyces euteiches]